MCHSHVCITGMSLAGVYYIYYVNIYYVNDTTKNEIVPFRRWSAVAP